MGSAIFGWVHGRAVAHLISRQDLDSGAFGRTSSYGHGIATYALAECYGMTSDPNLRDPVDAGIHWILGNQSRSRDRRNSGGWGYFSDSLRPEDTFSRNSVTFPCGWLTRESKGLTVT